MFEWLKEEISEIKTPRFHVVDGSADISLRRAILESKLPLPVSYKEFVLEFGNARLYRISRDGYRIGVFAGPRERVLDDGSLVYQIGFYDSSKLYVRPNDTSKGSSIFEIESDVETKVTSDFEEWLAGRCANARGEYDKEQWGEILRGPEPFFPDEEAIIEARKKIYWKVLDIDPAGNHIFEVKNASDRRLPLLTVGVRSKSGHLNGAIRLPIANIGPGQSDILHFGCYKNLVNPNEIDFFELPNPMPEDREYYKELEANKD